MSWKFIESDNFELSQLIEWEKWFRQDLRASQSWYNKIQYMPDSFPGKEDTLKIAEDDLKISRGNLEKCIKAIKIAKTKPENKVPEDKKI